MLKTWPKYLLIIALFLGFYNLCLNQNPSFANSNQKHTASIEADTISYDNPNNQIVAQGNVIAQNQEYQTKTEKIIINHHKKTASSKTQSVISSLNKEDNYWVEKFNFDYGKKTGTLDNINAKLNNNQITFKAKNIEVRDKKYILHDVIATPCKICDICDTREALWQLRATKIQASDDDIFYKNVSFDLRGKPILYLPYFKTPGLNCTRRSGFLMPKLYYNNKWGIGIRLPYYWNIMPSMDFTISTSLYTGQRPLYDWEFRHLLKKKSGYRIRVGSMYSAPEDDALYTANSSDLNSYVNLDANFQLSDKSDIGLNFERIFAPGSTVLKGYQISTNDILVSNSYWRKYLGPNHNGYISTELTSLQDLRNQKKYTNILPRTQIFYSHPIPSEFWNERIKTFLEINGEFISIHGENQQGKKAVADRIKLGTHILFNYYDSSTGTVSLKPGLTLEGLNHNTKNNQTSYDEQEYAILSPNLELMFKKPFFNLGNKSLWTIEPIAKLTLIPTKKRLIPYTEQSFLEYNNSSIFSSNLRRLIDQGMQGSTLEYGIGTHYFSDYDISLTLGHSYRFYSYKENNVNYNGKSIFPNNKKSSHYTINTQLTFKNLSIAARSWLRTDNIRAVHSEIDAFIKLGKIKLDLDYTFFDNKYFNTDINNGNQEIGANIWYKIHSNWLVNFNTRTKIGKKSNARSSSRFINKGIGIQYEMDCLKLNFAVSRKYPNLQNVKPTTTYAISLGIPSLGL